MVGLRLHDLESLEAISQNACARRIFLKMAAMSQAGKMRSFLHVLADDDDVDEETKATLAELAHDRAFLYAVEDYLRRTELVH